MFAELLKHMDQSFAELRTEQTLIRKDMNRDMHLMRLEFEKSQALMRAEITKDIQRISWTTITVVATLVGIFGSMTTLMHWVH